MSAMEKKVECIECKKEIVLKTFRFTKAKFLMGKGWICADCQNKEAEGAEKAPQSAPAK